MNRDQTIQLLKFLSNVFPTLKLTEGVLDAWHFVLADEDATAVLSAARYLAKTHDSGFHPTPSDVLKAGRDLAHPLEDAVTVFNAGPKKATTARAKEAWRLWNVRGDNPAGASRWGMLPDPRYSNAEEAERRWSFVRNEFVEIYDSLKNFDEKQALHLTHSQSVTMLEELGRRGAPTLKLLARKEIRA